jgi:hypothetical protein
MQDEIEFHQVIRTDVIQCVNEYGNTEEGSRSARILHMNAEAINNLYGMQDVVIIIYHSTKDDFNYCRSLRFAKTKGTIFVTALHVPEITSYRSEHNIICTGSFSEFQRSTRTLRPTRVYTIKYQCGKLCNFVETDFIFGRLFWRDVMKNVNYDPFKPKDEGAVRVFAPGENNNNQPRHVRAIGRPNFGGKDDESSSDESSDEPLERSEDSGE